MSEGLRRPVTGARPRILTLLHQEDYPLGALEGIARGRVELDVIDTTRQRIPEDFTSARAHGVISLGGDMGATEDNRFAFLRQEIALLRTAHKLDLPVLGICLGGQMLARALGGSVVPLGGREIGLHPIDFVSADEVLGAPGRRPCFLWHRDRFDAPPRARVLARSERCSQAFRIGRSFGVQFHPEMTADHARRLLRGRSAEILGVTTAERAAVERGLDGDALASGAMILDAFVRIVAHVGSTTPVADRR